VNQSGPFRGQVGLLQAVFIQESEVPNRKCSPLDFHLAPRRVGLGVLGDRHFFPGLAVDVNLTGGDVVDVVVSHLGWERLAPELDTSIICGIPQNVNPGINIIDYRLQVIPPQSISDDDQFIPSNPLTIYGIPVIIDSSS
jgi:hypothetical protein